MHRSPRFRALLPLLTWLLPLALVLGGCGSGNPTTTGLTVTPLSVQLQAGLGRQQFSATFTNSAAANSGVIWQVNGVQGGNASDGTITSQGMYSAPVAVPAGDPVMVTAVSAGNSSVSASAQVTITPPVAVTVAPTTVTLSAGATQQFTATVTNATSTAVTWAVNGTAGGSAAVGTVTTNGLYTAPASFPGLSQVNVTVTSVADPSRTATAIVQLSAPVSVTVNPATVTVNLGTTQPFVATVTGTTNAAVTWAVNGTAGGSSVLGTIDANGNYTAPQNLPTNPVETISATSVADPSASGSAKVTLAVPPSSFTLSPTTVDLSVGKSNSVSQAFQITTSAGFTQPITLQASGAPVNVTATLDHASVTGTATVNLTLAANAVALAAQGTPITLTANSTDASGNPLVQTATVLLTVTGWAGHVRTLAGQPGGVGYEDGSGATDELQAWSITTDGGQNVYFTDKRGSALRDLTLNNETVTTLIGGPYNFTYPDGDGVVFDAANQTLYVADGIRNEVVGYVLGQENVTVLAGSGVAGYADGVGAAAQFAYPHGIALSSDGKTLYVADTDNEVIRAVTIASGAVTTIAGRTGVYNSVDGAGTAATFCQPTGLDIDPAGANLYITDACGYVVRQLALAGDVVTTVAGNGTVGFADGAALSAEFTNLNGVRADPHAGSNLIYVADANAVRAIHLGANAVVYTVVGSLNAGNSDGPAGGASLYQPLSLGALADATGANTTSLFVADSGNGLVRRIDFADPLTATSSASVSATVSTVAGQAPHYGTTDGPGTGANYANPSQALFNQPSAVATDGTTAYVIDSTNGAVRQIDLATSTVTTVAGPHEGYEDGPAGQAAFYVPGGLSWLPSQNVIYIADAGNGAIRKLDLTAQTVSTVAGTDAAGYADGPVAAARFNHPYGVVASADGTKLYVADTGNNAIRLIDLNAGTVSTLAGSGALGNTDGVGAAARFAEPNGIILDATGANLYVSDFENHAIREVNIASGAVTTVVGFSHSCGYADGPAATATLCTPAQIASDGHSLYWGDYDTGLLRVMDLATGQVSTIAGTPGVMHMNDGDLTQTAGELTGPVLYNGVFGLAATPDGSIVLFCDKTADVIRIIY